MIIYQGYPDSLAGITKKIGLGYDLKVKPVVWVIDILLCWSFYLGLKFS